ncbi:MAG: DUF2520 domain-containing protein [Bacteroidetes bacterium]|nr:DUF2520 domain-containing protein [Bacteroidota bacterium]
MKKIVLIGAGKLASQLAPALSVAPDVKLLQVYNRNHQKAKDLALSASCDYAENIRDISSQADLYIIAVSDRAIGQVATELKTVIPADSLVVHTSGATPSTVLGKSFSRFGVFYPLQTFSLSRKANFEEIPMLLDAARETDLIFLEELANSISPKVYRITDEERAQLHVAAVFACNFSNHNYVIAQEILGQKGLSLDLLRPLILETARMVQENSPENVQTGPAIRGDQPTLDRHLEQLADRPDLQHIYKLLSKHIQDAGSNRSS